MARKKKDQDRQYEDQNQEVRYEGNPNPGKKKKPIYKRVWFWVIVICLVIGVVGNLGGSDEEEETAEEGHIYDNAQAIDIPNGAGTDVIGQYSLIEADSSDVTLEDLEDWYFNYIEETDYNWYVILYTDKEDYSGVVEYGLYIIDNAVLVNEGGEDVYKYGEDAEDTVYYKPNDDEKTLEVEEGVSLSAEEETETEETIEEDYSFVTVLTSLGTFEETTYTGNGDDVITLDVTGYPILLDITYSGDRNFIVYTLDEAGENVDLLVNTIGSYSGVVTDYKDYSDVTMLSVESSGDWSITVKPMDSMEELVNGQSYSGDGVYYIDTDDLTTITLTNSGESNFIVYGIGISDVDLLVNEIGDYSGTVVWTESQSFLIINSEGTWTVSW